MIRKLEETDLQTLFEYIKRHEAETYYFRRLLDTKLTSEEVFGYYEENQLQGVLCFTNTNALILHVKSLKIFNKLQFLKLIKERKPKFIKGDRESIAGAYRILYRTFKNEFQTDVLLMRYTDNQVAQPQLPVEGAKETVQKSIHEDIRFFLAVNKYFGRMNAPVKELEKIIFSEFENGERAFIIKDNHFAAQGMIEESGVDFATIGGIFVSPLFRGQGYGRAMSLNMTKCVLEMGKTPYLFVKKDNNIAQKLYESIGYQAMLPYTILEVTF